MHGIHIMNYDDLNFLHLIDALYRERSVSRAAIRLDLTQPAVSHALARMRVKFGDELFVRSGSGMTPTPAGERISQGARRVLELIQVDIWNGPTFNPLTSERNFAVGMTDMGGTAILPRVISAIAEQAPSVTIKPVAVRPSEVSEMLEAGTIDLAWGFFGNLSDKLYQQTLFRRSLTGIVRRGSQKNQPIDFNRFVSSRHVLASATSQMNEMLQQKVREGGASMKVALEVPYLLAIPGIIAGSDYLATVPNELAELFLRIADIEVFALPMLVPDIAVKQYWHARFNTDAGNQWFRTLIKSTFSETTQTGADVQP